MSVSNPTNTRSSIDQEAIDNLKQFLRIKSVHPNINYDECIEFLKNQANSLNLPYKIYHTAPTKPVLIMTWTGQEPGLPSIFLCNHMDVVPVFEDKWTHKPFEAETDENGNIFARGAQDMKSIAVQRLEAVKRLKKDGVTLKRTVHLAFVPEEELTGVLGMRDFTPTEDFRKLNVGFSLDEGMPSLNNELDLFYGERIIWQIRVHCPGQQGHGSLLLPHPPGNKIDIVINKFNAYRAQELKKLKEDPKLKLGDVTTVNLTMLQGGVQANVVPPEFVATYDMRIVPTIDIVKFEADINQWCKEAGEGVWIEFINKESKVENTKLDDSNIFWTAFKKAIDELKIQIKPTICAGATDSRYIRKLGIPAFGFSPLPNTTPLIHDNDEYINTDIFLKGIDVFKKIILAVANVN